MSARGKRAGGNLRRGLSRNERQGNAGFAPLQDYVRCPHCNDNSLSPPALDGEQKSISRITGCEVCWPEDERQRESHARKGFVYAPHRDPYRYNREGALLDRNDADDLLVRGGRK